MPQELALRIGVKASLAVQFIFPVPIDRKEVGDGEGVFLMRGPMGVLDILSDQLELLAAAIHRAEVRFEALVLLIKLVLDFFFGLVLGLVQVLASTNVFEHLD